MSAPVAAVEPVQPGASEVAAEYQHSEISGPLSLLKTAATDKQHNLPQNFVADMVVATRHTFDHC